MIIGMKRGDLQNNVLSLVIVAIGLGLLVFGFVKLYQVTVSNESKDAQKTIDTLFDKVETLKDGESNNFLIQGFKGSENWKIIGWDKNEKGRPDKCFFESCICICKGIEINVVFYGPQGKGSLEEAIFSRKSEHAKNCNINGFCRVIEGRKVNLAKMEYSLLYYPAGRAKVLYTYLKIDKGVNVFFVEKSKDSVNIIENVENINPDEFSKPAVYVY